MFRLLFLVRIGAYVERGPVTSTVVCIVVQTNVARGAFHASFITLKYMTPVVCDYDTISSLYVLARRSCFMKP